MKFRKVFDTTEELGSWYDNKYEEMDGCWQTPREEVEAHLDALGVESDPEKLLLDIGCGDGSFIAIAGERVRAVGIEVSQYCINNRVKGTNVFLMSAEEMYFNKFFDFIVSMGSLEHTVDIEKALLEIAYYLKTGGKFLFYNPNELWTHEDQPNERTATDEEWVELIEAGGELVVTSVERMGDNTRFIGTRI